MRNIGLYLRVKLKWLLLKFIKHLLIVLNQDPAGTQRSFFNTTVRLNTRTDSQQRGRHWPKLARTHPLWGGLVERTPCLPLLPKPPFNVPGKVRQAQSFSSPRLLKCHSCFLGRWRAIAQLRGSSVCITESGRNKLLERAGRGVGNKSRRKLLEGCQAGMCVEGGGVVLKCLV